MQVLQAFNQKVVRISKIVANTVSKISSDLEQALHNSTEITALLASDISMDMNGETRIQSKFKNPVRIIKYISDQESNPLIYCNTYIINTKTYLSLQDTPQSNHHSNTSEENLKSVEKEIQRCIGLLRINCLDFNSKKGRILFPLFSFISHSCVNNAKHVMYPKTKEKKIR